MTAHLFVQATTPTVVLGWLLVGWCLASSDPQPRQVSPYRAPILAATLLAFALAAPLTLALVEGSSDLGLGQRMTEAGLKGSGPTSMQQYYNGLALLRRAESELYPHRAEQAFLQEARALQNMYFRSSAALRNGPQQAFWAALRARTEAALDAARDACPLDPYPWRDRARFDVQAWYMDGGHFDAAWTSAVLARSRRACELDPFSPLFCFEHAQRCAVLGRAQEAEAAYRRSAELCPENPVLRAEYERFRSAGNQATPGAPVRR